MTPHPPSPIAPISRRVVAYLIDVLIPVGILIIGFVIAGILGGMAVSGQSQGLATGALVVLVAMYMVLLAWGIAYLIMLGGKGSVGMRAQRIRLVKEADGSPLGFGYALLRYIVFGATASIIVGYFTPLFDKTGRNQGWHDLVVKSLMVEAAPSRQSDAAAAPAAPSAPPPPVMAPPAEVAAPRFGAPVPPPPAEPAFLPPSSELPDQTIIAHRPAPPVPAASPTDGGLIAFVPGITQDAPATRGPEPAPPAPTPPAGPVPPPEPPAPPAAAVHPAPAEDDDLESTRISVPGHRLVFTWDDGTRIEVSRRTIFGRNPAAEGDAPLVSVRDETLSLSKTHFEAAAEASGGWVLDRHSTNGMTIIRGGERIDCPPGEKVRVRLGDAIEIGDRIVTVGGYV